jgi:predicted HicB family RNase H-like nuclease
MKQKKKSPRDYHYEYKNIFVRLKPDLHKKLVMVAEKEGFRSVAVFVRFLITHYVNSRIQEK